MLTAVLYGLTTFHKLNGGYLDPQANCFANGIGFVAEYTGFVAPFQTFIGYGGAFIIPLTEFALFVFLLRPKTWLYGCDLPGPGSNTGPCVPASIFRPARADLLLLVHELRRAAAPCHGPNGCSGTSDLNA